MIIGATLLSSEFVWTHRQGFAEISSLPSNTFGPLYDDACDIGFVVLSMKTNKKVAFFLNCDRRDSEGDILEWYFLSTCKQFEIIIAND